MNVTIKNLGYVKDVSLDLDKKLTILCGPNNTGKTYVAYAIYGLMKFGQQGDAPEKLESIVKSLHKKGQIKFSVFDILLENQDYLEEIAREYTKRISNVFAADVNGNAFKDAKVQVVLNNTDLVRKSIFDKVIVEKIQIGSTTFKIEKERGTDEVSCILVTESNGGSVLNSTIPLHVINGVISGRLFHILLEAIFPDVYIAPVERIAINLFSKELSLKRVTLVDKLLALKEDDDDDPFDLMHRRATRYPTPIRDNLGIAEDLTNIQKNKSDFAFFADEIEKDILKGKITVSKEGEVQFSPEKVKRLKLPIHLTASVVKSLSSLVLYLRHLATEGDYIIIDEPELNLHPDNQIIIAQIIAKIVNKGFKVMISTHSDYMIREINNMIMANRNKELAAQYGYTQDIILKPEDVSAILFTYEKAKAVNLPVDETGFNVQTIDDITHSLNQRSQGLFLEI